MIPSSDCPPWPPDHHPRTLPRTGSLTPLPRTRPLRARSRPRLVGCSWTRTRLAIVRADHSTPGRVMDSRAAEQVVGEAGIDPELSREPRQPDLGARPRALSQLCATPIPRLQLNVLREKCLGEHGHGPG